MGPIRGTLPLLTLLLTGLAWLRPAQVNAQSSAIAPVRGEVTEAGKATPLPGAVLRWLLDASDANAPVITTTSDDKGRFVLVRPARAASRLVVQALGYRPDTLAVPAYRRALPAGGPARRPGAGLR